MLFSRFTWKSLEIGLFTSSGRKGGRHDNVTPACLAWDAHLPQATYAWPQILCTWYDASFSSTPSFYVSRMLRRPLSIKKACWRPYRYRPAKLDLHEGGIIWKPFKRTSTATICFKFFIFDLEYFKQLQSSELLHAKKPPILLLVRFTVCMCSSLDLFRQTVLHKYGRDINCSLDCGSQVKIHHSATRTKIELHFGGFFQCASQ